MRIVARSALLAGVLLSALVSPSAGASPVTVEMRTLSYAPTLVTFAAPGRTIRWKNVTHPDRLHDAVSSLSDYFGGTLIPSGSSARFTFAAAGTFTYVCSIHDVMLGRVEVAPVVTLVDDGSGRRLRIVVGTIDQPVTGTFRSSVFVQGPSDEKLRYRRTTRRAVAHIPVDEPGQWTVMVRLRNRLTATASSDSPTVTVTAPA